MDDYCRHNVVFYVSHGLKSRSGKVDTVEPSDHGRLQSTRTDAIVHPDRLGNWVSGWNNEIGDGLDDEKIQSGFHELCLLSSASRNLRAYGPDRRLATICSRGKPAIKSFRQNQAIAKRKRAEDAKRTVDKPPAEGNVANWPAN